MSSYLTFLRKELTENIRTKRILVLACVFIAFAITGALLARYMGEFFAMVMPSYDETAQMLIEIMGNPRWEEAYVQLYSQLGQVGVLAVVFMYMGTVQREIRSGTASLMFSKGMGYTPFILAKFTMAGIITTVITVVSALITYVYTFVLFEEAGQIGNVIFGSLIFSAATLMMLAVVIMCSSFTKSSAVSGGLSFGAFFLLVVTTAIPRFGAYSPFSLFSFPVAISLGDVPQQLLVSILIAAALAVVSLLLAIRSVSKAEG